MRKQRFGSEESFMRDVNIADAVHHKPVRRQRMASVVEVRDDHVRLKDAVVHQLSMGVLPPAEETSRTTGTGSALPR